LSLSFSARFLAARGAAGFGLEQRAHSLDLPENFIDREWGMEVESTDQGPAQDVSYERVRAGIFTAGRVVDRASFSCGEGLKR
jgi:hypothetical protein